MSQGQVYEIPLLSRGGEDCALKKKVAKQLRPRRRGGAGQTDLILITTTPAFGHPSSAEEGSFAASNSLFHAVNSLTLRFIP